MNLGAFGFRDGHSENSHSVWIACIINRCPEKRKKDLVFCGVILQFLKKSCRFNPSGFQALSARKAQATDTLGEVAQVADKHHVVSDFPIDEIVLFNIGMRRLPHPIA